MADAAVTVLDDHLVGHPINRADGRTIKLGVGFAKRPNIHHRRQKRSTAFVSEIALTGDKTAKAVAQSSYAESMDMHVYVPPYGGSGASSSQAQPARGRVRFVAVA